MKVSADTIIRTIILLVALCNQALTALGKNPLPFAEEDLYEVLSLVATTAAAVWAFWKNNSFTKSAVAADEYMSELKHAETKAKESEE